jgi:20S proteasome alpha/beta subunit
MTLCIAAECRGYVIVGSDTRAEDGYTSVENQNKLQLIQGVWPVLIAGTISRANDLVQMIDLEFESVQSSGEKITGRNFATILKQAVRKQKYQLVDESIVRQLGISYVDFLEKGRTSLSDESFAAIETEIRGIQLDCELIAIFFHQHGSYIYRVASDCTVVKVDHFCCIGSGETLAHSSLSFREHESDQILRTSLYRVFEAHQMAKRAPGVGEYFAVSVFNQDKSGKIIWRRLSDGGYSKLERLFKRFGPKRISSVPLAVDRDLEWYSERNLTEL